MYIPTVNAFKNKVSLARFYQKHVSSLFLGLQYFLQQWSSWENNILSRSECKISRSAYFLLQDSYCTIIRPQSWSRQLAKWWPMPTQLILTSVMISPIGEMVTYAYTQLILAAVVISPIGEIITISPIGEMVTYAYLANPGHSHDLANWRDHDHLANWRDGNLCLLSWSWPKSWSRQLAKWWPMP